MQPTTLHRKNGQSLTEQIVEQIRTLIEKGTLPPGARIPSVREAHEQFGVSPGTVVEAYKLLQHRGWIQSRPQSGYFVRPQLPQSIGTPRPTRPPLKIHEVPCLIAERLHEHSRRDDIIGLGAAVPDRRLMPVESLTRQLTKALRDEDAKAFCYAPSEGVRELRIELARRMIDAGCSVGPDDIVVTSGATEALYLSLKAATKPGDVVAVESPTYHGILDVLCGLGLRALPVSTCSSDGVSVNALERALKARKVTAVALIASYTNPLGGSLPVEDRERIAELARVHDVTVVEDDVYGDLSFDGSRPPVIKSFDSDDRVMYCSSFSKTLAPGFRVGWCLPGRHFEEVLSLKRKLNVSSTNAPQHAIARYLAAGSYQRHLRQLRRAYAEQVSTMIEHVAASFPSGTRISRPLGGSVVWIEMPDGVDALRLFEDAEAVGIGIAPGPLFDPEGGYKSCIRLSCARPWSTAIAQAVARLGLLAAEQLTVDRPSSRRARRKPATAALR